VTYTLTIDQKATHLHAVVTGDNSPQAVEQYMEELMRECTARGASRVLIEERLVGPRLGPFEVFSLVSKGTARYRQAVEALAFVDVNAEGSVMRFAEEVPDPSLERLARAAATRAGQRISDRRPRAVPSRVRAP
jgi:hypothetical protein